MTWQKGCFLPPPWGVSTAQLPAWALRFGNTASYRRISSPRLPSPCSDHHQGENKPKATSLRLQRPQQLLGQGGHGAVLTPSHLCQAQMPFLALQRSCGQQGWPLSAVSLKKYFFEKMKRKCNTKTCMVQIRGAAEDFKCA